MVELLVVIVIMSVLLSIIVPSMGSTDVARVRTATRGIMQVSRYARSMAVLRQETLYLEISSDGKLRVSGGKAGGGAGSAAPASASEDASDAGAPSDRAETGGAVTQMSDVNTEKVYQQVRFQVELDEDALSDAEREDETALERVEVDRQPEDGERETPGEQAEVVKIPYESNGRCLPYRVTVTPMVQSGDGEIAEGGADKAVLVVDRFGNVKVEEELE